jgi:hypothetical protein
MKTKTKPEDYRDWQGRPLSAERITEIERMPKCRWCGDTVNYPPKEARDGQQTVEDVRRMLGPHNYVLTFGGWIDVDCWLEHHAPFMKYVRLEVVSLPKHGPCLVEQPYPGDRVGPMGAFGIYPIAAKEYALA